MWNGLNGINPANDPSSSDHNPFNYYITLAVNLNFSIKIKSANHLGLNNWGSAHYNNNLIYPGQKINKCFMYSEIGIGTINQYTPNQISTSTSNYNSLFYWQSDHRVAQGIISQTNTINLVNLSFNHFGINNTIKKYSISDISATTSFQLVDHIYSAVNNISIIGNNDRYQAYQISYTNLIIKINYITFTWHHN